jgi:hypothetical protein
MLTGAFTQWLLRTLEFFVIPHWKLVVLAHWKLVCLIKRGLLVSVSKKSISIFLFLVLASVFYTLPSSFLIPPYSFDVVILPRPKWKSVN